jgi:hypothetical protein
VWRLAPAAALAAAVAATVVVAARPHHDPAVTSDAAQVLRLAAAEAGREPILTARPDQFVYVDSLVAWAGASMPANTADKATYQPPVEKDRRIWLSVDGTRDGLLREKAVHQADAGNKLVLDDVPLPVQGNPIPAYARNLPTDAKGMRDFLYTGGNSKHSADSSAWTKIGDTLREQYVPPASVAAMFEAAATIPGTSVVHQADLAGRKGIAVSRVEAGTRHDLIFDATTYHFLGERDVVVSNEAAPFPKNAVIGWTAQLKIAIVDRVGQLP